MMLLVCLEGSGFLGSTRRVPPEKMQRWSLAWWSLAQDESSLFSSESVLKLQKLIFAGSPLSEVLTNIAQVVEAQAA